VTDAPVTKPLAKRLQYRIEAAILFALTRAASLLPMERASALGAWFGRSVLKPLLGKSRRQHANVGIAFPEADEATRADIVGRMWENIGRIMFEYGFVVRLRGPLGQKHIRVAGIENVRAAAARGKGVLLVTGHFGNWEVGAPALAHAGISAAVVTRPPNNPHVARWIEKIRADAGTTEQIAKGSDGLKRIFSKLRKGENVAMLVDQHLAEGIPVPFFGRDAMTTHAPATLARKLGAAIVPFTVRRLAGAEFEVIAFPEIAVAHSDDADRDVLEATEAINRFVEAEVRRAPEQWLWMHDRWKPVATLSKRAGRTAG
jgi:KDO2-lipid IV(A) lauroyltransferase